MKNSLLIVAAVFAIAIQLCGQGSVEQYTYLKKRQAATWVPIIRYKSKNDLYAEGRYNYEDLNTLSLYAGKVFENEGRFLYSITPLIGGVLGKFKGASAAMNLNLRFMDFSFSSQSQYTFSWQPESQNFFFSWTELSYQPRSWIYFGLSMQSTYFSEIDAAFVEPGVVTGFEFGRWSIPIYGFSLFKEDRYFVLGINLHIGAKGNVNHLW